MENITVPVYYTVGNHEYSSETGVLDLELTTFRSNVDNPGNEVYYSFNSPQNDTHFIVLNTEYYWGTNTTRQQEQLDWLAADIAANDIDQIVAMFHRPMWGVNPGRVGEYELLRDKWHDLLLGYGVDLIVNGHDHHGYYTYRNHSLGSDHGSAHFLISGGGTAQGALTKPIPDYFNPAKNPSGPGTLLSYDKWYEGREVCLVNVTGNGMIVDMIGEDGSIAFSFNTSDSPVHEPFEVETTTTTSTVTSAATETTVAPGFGIETLVIIFASTSVIKRRKNRK